MSLPGPNLPMSTSQITDRNFAPLSFAAWSEQNTSHAAAPRSVAAVAAWQGGAGDAQHNTAITAWGSPDEGPPQGTAAWSAMNHQSNIVHPTPIQLVGVYETIADVIEPLPAVTNSDEGLQNGERTTLYSTLHSLASDWLMNQVGQLCTFL